jgi:glycosyltransferase involved in cell wall biosynthesis
MKIIQIAAGSGGTFYCENCMRDPSLVKALRGLGHDAVIVPMYLPLFGDEPGIARDVPVFFGGVNVYLQQRFGLFRKTPRWFDRLLDSRLVLKAAAKRAGMTRAAGMGKMTLSMIRGDDGNQAKELDRLLEWLGSMEKPDVVHLSSVMLIGLARRLKHDLGIPVVASLQDEHVWLDALDKPYDRACWDAIGDRASDIDAFVFVSRFYRDFIRARLDLPGGRCHVVHLGIDPDSYRPGALPFDPPVIGYLSRMTAALGLARLVDAVIDLRDRKGLENTRLRAMGGVVGRDRKFVRALRRKLAAAGAVADGDFLRELDLASRQRFLNSLSVMCVPVEGGAAAGLFMLEAWASGVPVIQPNAGAFPELIDMTGGGIAYDTSEPDALASALESLLRDPPLARELGQAGRRAVTERLGVGHMAENILNVYEAVCPGNR